jgi:hypothetical protein
MLKAEEYVSEVKEISGVMVMVATYKIGEQYYCHVSNYNPGGTFSRAAGMSIKEAKQQALTEAREKLRNNSGRN